MEREPLRISASTRSSSVMAFFWFSVCCSCLLYCSPSDRIYPALCVGIPLTAGKVFTVGGSDATGLKHVPTAGTLPQCFIVLTGFFYRIGFFFNIRAVAFPEFLEFLGSSNALGIGLFALCFGSYGFFFSCCFSLSAARSSLYCFTDSWYSRGCIATVSLPAAAILASNSLILCQLVSRSIQPKSTTGFTLNDSHAPVAAFLHYSMLAARLSCCSIVKAFFAGFLNA
jgi:hypothetical protein